MSKICSVQDCDRPQSARGYCTIHYARFMRNGITSIKRRYNGTGTITKHGYKKVSIGGEQVFEHRLIMEKHLGRKLKPFPQEAIHHINGNKTDNRVENMLVISQSEHGSITLPPLHPDNGVTKVCSKCGRELPLHRFSKEKARKQPRSQCKSCQYEYNKARLRRLSS